MPEKKQNYGYSQLFSVMQDSFKYWKLFLLGFITLLFVTGMDIYFPFYMRNIINDFIGSRVVSVSENKKINAYLLKDPKDSTEFENKGIKVYTIEGLKYVKHSDLKKMPKDQLRQIREKDIKGILKRLKFILILLLMYIIIYFIHYFSINYIGQTMMYDLRNRVFNKLTGFKMSYYTQIPVGVLVTRVINDVESINKFFSEVLISWMKDLLVFVGVFAMMFLINKELSLMILLIIPVLILLTYFYQRTMRDAYRLVRKQIAKINAFLSENFSGMFVIKAFNKENKGLEMFAKNNQNMFEAQKKQVILMATFMPVINVLRFFSMAIILVYGGRKILRGQMMYGDMVAFFSYVEMFFRPIRSMAQKFNVLQSAQAALERVFTVLSDKKNDEYEGGDVQLEFNKNIRFEDVSFEYKKDKQVLKDVSFNINAGEKVAFVGHTGAGKTTIINLITQFYKNAKGKILIDDIEISEYDRDSLRSNLAYVPQDVFIFSESIYYNIAFEERSQRRIESIKDELQIGPFLDRQVNGLETVMLERGNSLSYGEKQLLAFARALYTDPQIIVLDEATSNIDSNTEDMIQGALERLLEGRTALIIAHRLSTIRNCDRIFVLNKGRIVESGKHDELLSKKGYYYKLYQYQSFN